MVQGNVAVSVVYIKARFFIKLEPVHSSSLICLIQFENGLSPSSLISNCPLLTCQMFVDLLIYLNLPPCMAAFSLQPAIKQPDEVVQNIYVSLSSMLTYGKNVNEFFGQNCSGFHCCVEH